MRIEILWKLWCNKNRFTTSGKGRKLLYQAIPMNMGTTKGKGEIMMDNMKIQRPERMRRIFISLEVLDIDAYSKVILANIIYKKCTHPNSHLDAIIQEVISSQKYVPDQFKEIKSKINVQEYWTSEVEELEEKLHQCKNLPKKDLYNGKILENTIMFYVKELTNIEQSPMKKEIMNLPISKEMREVILTMVFLKFLYPNMSLDECTEKIRLHIKNVK